MRVKQVDVFGLFGLFEHHIKFNLDERITIVHGPNGYGKTIVLKMIAGLLTSSFSVFMKHPFSRFELWLDDGSCYSVERRTPESGQGVERSDRPLAETPVNLVAIAMRQPRLLPPKDPFPELAFTYRDPAGVSVAIHASTLQASRTVLREIDRHLPGNYVLNLSEGYWTDSYGQNRTSLFEIMETWGTFLRDRMPEIDSLIRGNDPHLQRLRESLHVRFIGTQRLDRADTPRSHLFDPEEANPPRTAVEEYSLEIVSRFRTILAAYAAISSELDRTFPERLLQEGQLLQDGETRRHPNNETLKSRFNELEAKRTRLINFGFLDKEGGGLSGIPQSLYETRADVISVYVSDTEQKLNTFESEAASVGLFLKIINARFKYKTLRISRDKGFVFETRLGELSPSALSSGEQHELILVYELLFKVNKTWLVLLDEPEISLHVGWQQSFLDDLQDIVKLSDVDVLMATHSPVVIGTHWDLTQQLQGPDDKEANE